MSSAAPRAELRRTVVAWLAATIALAGAACAPIDSPGARPTARPVAYTSMVPFVVATPAPPPVSRAEIVERLRPLAEVLYMNASAGAISQRRLAGGVARAPVAGNPLSLEPEPGEGPSEWQQYPDGARRHYFESGRELLTTAEGRPLAESRVRILSGFETGRERIVSVAQRVVGRRAGDGAAVLTQDVVYERERDEQAQPVRIALASMTLLDPASGRRIRGEKLEFDARTGKGGYEYAYPELGYREIGVLDSLTRIDVPTFDFAEPLEGQSGTARVVDAAGRLLFTKRFEQLQPSGSRLLYTVPGGLVLDLQPLTPHGSWTGTIRLGERPLGTALLLRVGDDRTGYVGLSLVFDDDPAGPEVWQTRLEEGRITLHRTDSMSLPAPPAPTARPGTPYDTGAWRSYTVLGEGVNLRFGASSGPMPLLLAPKGLALDATAGVLYVAEQRAHRVLRLDLATGVLDVLAGYGLAGSADGKGTAARFNLPDSLVLDSPRRRLLVSEQGGHVIRAVSLEGEVTTIAGDGEPGDVDGQGRAASFNEPAGMAVAADGTIYVADAMNHRIRRIAPDGRVTTYVAQFRSGANHEILLNLPRHLELLPDGALLISDFGNHRVLRLATDGKVTTELGTDTAGIQDRPTLGIVFPGALARDAAGYLYHVTNWNGGFVRRHGPDGSDVTLAGVGEPGSIDDTASHTALEWPHSLAVHPNGELVFFSEPTRGKVRLLAAGSIAATPTLPISR